MAAENGATTPALETLLPQPEAWDFFQALRRIECAAPSLPRIGCSARVDQDPVRFGQEASLAFAPTAIRRVEPATETTPARLLQRCFGLLGPNGPMPEFVTEYVHDRQLNYGDPTLARFLDVFHHRMVCFFYRAWACNRQTVSFDRPDSDRFSVYVASLCGLGEDSLRGRDAVPDVAKLHFSGALACQTRHAEGLRALLEDVLGAPTELEPFVGEWLPLDAGYRCRLGASPATGALGTTAVVGSHIWECRHKFRLRIGPMDLASFERLLPSGAGFRPLCDWVRNYMGDEFAWDARLVLRAQDVPPTHLGRSGRLGWSTWLQSRPPARDSEDLVLRPRAA